MAAGNRHLGYKEALNEHRGGVAGHQARLLLRFLDKAADRFRRGPPRTGRRLRRLRHVRRADRDRGVRVLPPGRAGADAEPVPWSRYAGRARGRNRSDEKRVSS